MRNQSWKCIVWHGMMTDGVFRVHHHATTFELDTSGFEILAWRSCSVSMRVPKHTRLTSPHIHLRIYSTGRFAGISSCRCMWVMRKCTLNYVCIVVRGWVFWVHHISGLGIFAWVRSTTGIRVSEHMLSSVRTYKLVLSILVVDLQNFLRRC